MEFGKCPKISYQCEKQKTKNEVICFVIQTTIKRGKSGHFKSLHMNGIWNVNLQIQVLVINNNQKDLKTITYNTKITISLIIYLKTLH